MSKVIHAINNIIKNRNLIKAVTRHKVHTWFSFYYTDEFLIYISKVNKNEYIIDFIGYNGDRLTYNSNDFKLDAEKDVFKLLYDTMIDKFKNRYEYILNEIINLGKN